MLQPRILNAVEAAGDLSPRQYGFRRGWSSIEVVKEAADVIIRAQTGNHYSCKVTLLVTFYVKNAFNSAKWTEFLQGLSSTQIFDAGNEELLKRPSTPVRDSPRKKE